MTKRNAVNNFTCGISSITCKNRKNGVLYTLYSLSDDINLPINALCGYNERISEEAV